MLTRAMAVAIVDTVSKDSTCAQRIESGFSVFGRSAGSMRNAYFWIHHPLRAPKEGSEEAKYICYGIAECTVDAINKAKFAKGSAISHLYMADQASRNVEKWGEHYATRITLKNGKGPDMINRCVFDWWATLDLRNPLIYLKEDDFTNNRPGTLFSTFSGNNS